ncbi:MAG: MotA/TolQ/ExbB proton channel family protein [Paludibacter sp.]|nr:MotA/TolQ/ExbB proton channel family protein [Bacteroidales bacterium]MCM1069870.1 MotA/TolQ/ExbB proton channel family protein [Prevotella sp.]MCM1353057.1 MotA/TolQ/ExbB proton channel family protein [Bacteroides sp.]MCM1443414.1 MotA/TolQ/ExbB proton channel family protein [Muribaculum sp.]MCM1481222.1 MotA/TolQ/ExbB proton channel family protein [Paludibacter sp.]
MANAATMVETVQEPMNLLKMAAYGGWIMIVLAVLLALAVYLFIERLVVIKAAKKEDKSFMDRIKDYIHEGKIDSALNLCRQTNTPSARMVEKGITRIGRPMNDVQVAIENVGNLEVANLEKNLVILATIAAGAPMLGFLGTVIGMVQTFYNMAGNASGVIELSALSEGMYQAMVTTIGGLIVGILVIFAYNYLVSRIDAVVRLLEGRTMEFMDLLNEPA